MRATTVFLGLVLALTGLGVRADEAATDVDALTIADDAKIVPATPSDWRVFLEAGAVGNWNHGATDSQWGSRESLDAHFETRLLENLRLVFSDRLDLEHLNDPTEQSTINTFKEAYVSWQITSDETLDAGRINLRYGVATGYNPTDFFRTDAIRSIVSIDPSSLRENRLGSVVVESQTLWEGSSFTALVSPKLASAATTADFGADWGATNGSNRWLLAASHQFTNDLNPQLLLFGSEGHSPQTGLNISSLLNNATVAFLEWSGGQSQTQLHEDFALPGPSSFHHRAALGITYTTDFNLSLTLEHEIDSAAVNNQELQEVARHVPYALLDYLALTQEQQDLPTRRAEFLYASWQDFTVKHLDLTSFLRFDPTSHSRTTWFEARYHFDRADVALQWQLETGQPNSVFGAIPTQRQLQVLLRYFL
ncbi:MAG: hypothetical protein ABSF50_13275 [Burkholderiaceae bacterium]